MSLKKAYLYLVSVISLVIWVIGAIMLINMAMKAWVFPNADRHAYYPSICESRVAPGGSQDKMPECDPEFQEKQRQAEEQNRSAQRHRDAAQALSMIVVAAPVWWYHWRQARREA